MKRAADPDDFFSGERALEKARRKHEAYRRQVQEEYRTFENIYWEQRRNAQIRFEAGYYPNGLYFALPARMVHSEEAKERIMLNYELYFEDRLEHSLHRMWYPAQWNMRLVAVYGYIEPLPYVVPEFDEPYVMTRRKEA